MKLRMGRWPGEARRTDTKSYMSLHNPFTYPDKISPNQLQPSSSSCPTLSPLTPPPSKPHLFPLSIHSLSPPLSLSPSLSFSLSPNKQQQFTMATTSLSSLHQQFTHHHHHQQSHHILFPQRLPLNITPSPSHSISLATSCTTTTTTPSPLLPPTTPSSTTTTTSFDALAHHLQTSDFRQADEETRHLLIALAGEQAQKRGYVFFSEVQFIAPSDLQAIDTLWTKHSAGKFGYSVQKRIWEKKANKDFTRFFIKVGWMRKLDTEVVQWNYRSFPNEFIWDLKDDTPEGHLPLTNALRGTQLLTSILTHPAFAEEEGEEEKREESDDGMKKLDRPKLMGGNRTLKTDYSF